MKILGIETSCDETAAAVVEDGYRLLSNVVASSADLHTQYGGVVPEIAARSHIEVILPVINQSLLQAFGSTPSSVIGNQLAAAEQTTDHRQLITQSDMWDQIDGIAVTYGAGLGGSLLIGVMTARTLAAALGKPLYAINHVEAHVYANFLTEEVRAEASSPYTVYGIRYTQPTFPMLAIIVSGGHSQLVLFRAHFDYTLLGQTHDDAIGEAFDKVAKMLGLPYPGGPAVAKLAEHGNPKAFRFPKAKMGKYDFSFSGLKTAVLRQAQAEIGEDYGFPSTKLSERLSEAQKRDIAASFQHVAIETLVDKTKLAYDEFRPKSVVLAGGVAANQELRRQLAAALPLPLEFPDPKLCTDNGAMVATLGCFKAMHKQPPADPYKLAIDPGLHL